jgi:hypothetical protein
LREAYEQAVLEDPAHIDLAARRAYWTDEDDADLHAALVSDFQRLKQRKSDYRVDMLGVPYAGFAM